MRRAHAAAVPDKVVEQHRAEVVVHLTSARDLAAFHLVMIRRFLHTPGEIEEYRRFLEQEGISIKLEIFDDRPML